MKATINIRDYLVDHYGARLHVPALIEIDEILEFCDIPAELDLEIDELLDRQKAIGIIWTTRHVKDQRPNLTEAEAWEVLQQCQRSHDRLSDPMLETIRQVAENLYPKASGKASLLARVAGLQRRVSALPEDEATNPAEYGSVAAMLDNVEQALGESRKE